MANELQIFSEDEISNRYGAFYQQSARLVLNRHKVPAALWPLIPYAVFWGVSDDVERESLVETAPREILDNLVGVVRAFDDQLDDWLAGPEAASANPSDEYIAFSAMRMAADFA
jgi:hypothetical protein